MEEDLEEEDVWRRTWRRTWCYPIGFNCRARVAWFVVEHVYLLLNAVHQ